jgi:hypothetical protein
LRGCGCPYRYDNEKKCLDLLHKLRISCKPSESGILGRGFLDFVCRPFREVLSVDSLGYPFVDRDTLGYQDVYSVASEIVSEGLNGVVVHPGKSVLWPVFHIALNYLPEDTACKLLLLVEGHQVDKTGYSCFVVRIHSREVHIPFSPEGRVDVIHHPIGDRDP